MAASVTLNVEINRSQATADLQAIDAAAKSITSKPVVINVQLAGADKAAAELAKLEKAQANAQAAQARAAAAAERTTQAQLNLEKARVNADARNQASAARVRVQELRNEGAAAREAAGGFSAMQVALGNLASRGIHMVLRKVTQGVKEALTEMKNVDTQLTNISKVSGKTGEELATIGDRAYDTASKYGEAASTYLESVYNMQKAGMGDQSEAMGELAIKTMLVGDTTEDVASKFLIASNAAWQLDGNMTRLTQIVDEADYINNNYATSLDKLAAGMPIVASIAAQTGMTAEETMAAIGTITAATQESGTKAATALRALILNISGEVGKYLTEEGEEFEVTEKSVKSMQGLLEKYAKTEMDAAKAAGEMIDPMTAIRAIFKGMKEDDLNDVELFNLLSGMGGKLRTNQLTALVQNFDTLYQDMMNGMKDAAGTADSEIERMMEAWERKTQKLKNTWTKFIADVVDTSGIKGALDGLIEMISNADSFLQKQKNPFFESESTMSELQSAKELISQIRQQLNDLHAQGDYDSGAVKNLEYELQLQQQILELKQKQYEMEHKEEAKKIQDRLTGTNPDYDPNYSVGEEHKYMDTHALAMLNYGINNVDFYGVDEYKKALQGVLDKNNEYYESVKKVQEVLGDGALTDAQKEFIDTYESAQNIINSDISFDGLVDGADGTADAFVRIVDAEGNIVAYAKDGIGLVKEETEAIDAKAQAQEDAAKAQEEAQKRELEGSDEVVEDLIQKQQELTEAQQAFDEATDPGERAEAYAELSEAQIAFDEALRDSTDIEKQRAAEAVAGAGDLEAAEAGATGEAEATADAAGGIDFSAATTSAGALTGELRAAAAAAAAISVGPMGGLLGVGFATGTTYAPGGPTLVNELGPELISENGRAYIANGGKPGVVNLSKGAIVLTAAQTKEALKGGNGAIKKMRAAAGPIGSGRVVDSGRDKPLNPTYAAGQVMFNGANIANLAGSGNLIIPTPQGMSIETKNKREKYERRKGNGVGGGGGSTAKSVEDLAKETKDILSNLEKQAKLADNRKQYDKEASLYAQGQKEIDKMVAAYKKAGYKETDDEVLDLLNKRYDYEKKKDAASKKTIEEAAKELKDKLSNLEKQADVAEKQEDYLSQVKFYEQAQEAIKTMVERYRKAGYKDDSDEILDLLKKNYDYADKQVNIYKDRWNELIDALETDTEQQELANALAEKQQALEDARLSLENAQKQRTIRTYNAATGQWEWVRDEAKVKSAQESLTKAEKDYADEVKDQAIQEIEKMRDTLADLNDVVLGPALTSVMAMAESSNEFQNFARALNAVYGVGSYLSSTEGSSRVISTANDSHDTIYTFGNVTLTEEQASTMSVAQLAQKLQVLKIS